MSRREKRSSSVGDAVRDELIGWACLGLLFIIGWGLTTRVGARVAGGLSAVLTVVVAIVLFAATRRRKRRAFNDK